MIKARWNRLTPQERIASVASAAAAAVWIAVGLTPERAPLALDQSAEPPSAAAAPRAEPSPVQPAPSAPVPVVTSVPKVAVQPEPAADPLALLRQGLASENSGTRIEALRKLVEQRTLNALPELLTRDLAQDPEVAPTLVEVTVQLAQRASAQARSEVASQLTRWLHTELARSGEQSDAARGNISVLVEALGSVDDPAASAGLIEVLQNEQLPLHVQTLAVQGLSRLHAPEARAALEQFRTRLGQTERAGFELELQQEAQAATDRVLAQLTQ
jgi:hypothetical protein